MTGLGVEVGVGVSDGSIGVLVAAASVAVLTIGVRGVHADINNRMIKIVTIPSNFFIVPLFSSIKCSQLLAD